jgi:hypothetical protein
MKIIAEIIDKKYKKYKDISIYLREYKWKEVLKYFNINLEILHNNFINYWSIEQIKDMYELLNFISKKPEHHILNYGYDVNIQFTNIDIIKTVEYFEWLVNNKVILKVIK